MTQDEFLDYAAGFRDREAEARRAAGLMSAAEAERSAAVDYERLVERGLGDPQVLFLTAWHDGSAVGWLWVELEDSPAGVRARPIDVFVEPSERGAGIGQAILTEVGQLLRDRGVVDVTFRVYGHNRRALALYERAGVTVQRAELRKALST